MFVLISALSEANIQTETILSTACMCALPIFDSELTVCAIYIRIKMKKTAI